MSDLKQLYEEISKLTSQDTLFDLEKNDLNNKLKEIMQLLKTEEHRLNFPKSALEDLAKLINSAPNVEIMCETFRVLRTVSAGTSNNGTELCEWENCISATLQFIRMNIASSNDIVVVAIRCGLQFIVNIVNSKPVLADFVWTDVKSSLLFLLRSDDEKAREFSAAVFHCAVRSSTKALDEIYEDKKFTELISELIALAHNGSHFSNIAVHELLEREKFLESFYDVRDVRTRIHLVTLTEEIMKVNSGSNLPISANNVEFLISKFISTADTILTTCEKPTVHELEPTEVASLLDVLTVASSMDQYRAGLQENKNLLTTAVVLLRSIHSLGKSAPNSFSVLSELDSFGSLSVNEGSDIQNHPVFGFKRSLVRLLGNLCWKCRENQDLLREEEAIPVLLECSNLDARNPFIQQFAILALKSICDSNTANQAVIASMTRRGVVQPAVLEQLGMSVEDTPSGKLQIKRTD